jgi:ABC-type sugar transport system ATPase subunit
VTHDQEEAMTIADRMAVFMEGRIVQVGTPEEVFAQPQSLDVAAFIGTPPMNFLPAKIAGRVALSGRQSIELARDYGPRRRPSSASVRARSGSKRAAIPAQVYLVEQLGENAIVDLHVGRRWCAPGSIAESGCAKARLSTLHSAPTMSTSSTLRPGSGSRKDARAIARSPHGLLRPRIDRPSISLNVG